MDKAPKKLWIDPDYIDNDCASLERTAVSDTQYIRADLVDELVGALEKAAEVFWFYTAYHENRDAFDKVEQNRRYAEQMEAALAKIKEET